MHIDFGKTRSRKKRATRINGLYGTLRKYGEKIQTLFTWDDARCIRVEYKLRYI